MHAAAARCAAAGCAAPPPAAAGGAGAVVTAADFAVAATGFQPSSAWAAAAPSGEGGGGGPQGWDDVGGCSAARTALTAALELPALAARVCGPGAAPPLRLRTGVLLYGPPGCGKTHAVVAACAAAHARVVTVKGPELFKKYIGASEAAVRDAFARAASAAPCVLFFDEFDALASRRGADSTGVSDRVVNQLLAELDGAAGLAAGVTVLAATSRPDLVDAALLRPGRLDRCVHVGVPDAADRRAVLKAASRGVNLTEEAVASLDGLADGAAGFTCADLSAIVADAALAAAKDAIEAAEREEGAATTTASSPPAVTAAHLAAARARRAPVAAARRGSGVRESLRRVQGGAGGEPAGQPVDAEVMWEREREERQGNCVSLAVSRVFCEG